MNILHEHTYMNIVHTYIHEHCMYIVHIYMNIVCTLYAHCTYIHVHKPMILIVIFSEPGWIKEEYIDLFSLIQ